MTRLLRPLLLAIIALALFAPGASAYWSAGGAGIGTGITATLAGGSTPTGVVTNQSVALTWNQTTFLASPLGSYSGGGYAVTRYRASNATPVTPGTACDGTVSGGGATATCTETNTPPGIWRYTIQPVLHSWTGAASAYSANLTVLPAAPATITGTQRPAAAIEVSWAAVPGVTGYNIYRRTNAGTYNFATPLNGGTLVAGTSFTDTTSVSGTTYRYVVRAVYMEGATALSSGNSPETAAITADGTVPTGVTMTNPGTPLRGSITLAGTSADTISGIGSHRYQYKLSAGTVWADACTGTTTPFSCSFNTASVADGLYDFRLIASDVAGNTTTSATITNRRIDNTPPTVNLVDPAAYLRQTIALSATASDAGSGLTSLAIQRRLSPAGAWTTICTGATSPQNCNFNTTTVADGTYDFRAFATDAAGNTNEQIDPGRVIDNTPPTVEDIQTVNGGVANRPDAGDQIIYTYSEPIDPTTILAGWNGASTAVTARFTYVWGGDDTLTIFNAANTTQVPVGSVNIGNGYISVVDAVFGGNPRFAATMTLTGDTLVVTLGALQASATSTSNGNRQLQWTGNTVNEDFAGNALTAGTANESGANDRDF